MKMLGVQVSVEFLLYIIVSSLVLTTELYTVGLAIMVYFIVIISITGIDQFVIIIATTITVTKGLNSNSLSQNSVVLVLFVASLRW